MQTLSRLFSAVLLTAATLAAQAPLLNLLVNAGSGIPPGSPNSGIAQGALFRLWGVGVGPKALQIATSPLPPTLGGTSIIVTVNGTTLSVPMGFVSFGQVGGVLPSNTPTGSGTLTLTYNDASGSIPITVVPAAFGISHADEYNSDNGWVTRNVAAVTFPDYQYVSDTNSAKPGDTLILWGTGLGATPNNGGDTMPGPVANVGSAPLVFVGGIQSPSVTYWGRSPAIAGLDQINFVVPADAPLGCNVSVVVQTATPLVVSNSPTIALATKVGVACVDPTRTLQSSFFGRDSLKVLFLALGQNETLTLNTDGTIKRSTVTSAGAQMYQLTQAATLATTDGLNASPSLGSCSTLPVTSGFPALYARTLDGGTCFTLAPSSGSPLTVGSPCPGGPASSDSTTKLVSGTWSFSNGAGGSDIGPEAFPFQVPAQVTWNNTAAVFSSGIDRTKPFTITWSGGDSNGYVRIAGSSRGGNFVCAAPTSPGQFTIPSSILMSLPADTEGQLVVATIAFPSFLGSVPVFDATVGSATFATTAYPVPFK
jgi:uncharacterized protein (TIGR03437 family)